MPGFSKQLATAIYNATLAGSRSNVPAATGVYAALHTNAPHDDTGGNETVYTNYARVNISAGVFTVITTGVAPEQTVTATSNADISFPACGATGATISHWAIWDATSGGNLLYSGEFTAPRSVQEGDVVVIPSGQLTINLV